MKRTLLFAAFLLIIAIAGVAVYFYNNMDSIVKNAIERTGSEITGTKVSVGSVDISLKTGRGTIRDVRVDNPEGYADGDALSLGEITLDLDVGSLNRDPIVIQQVVVSAPVVNAEVDEKLVTNVGVIRNHINGYRAASAPPANGDKQDAGYEKHFTIHSFDMNEGVLRGDATRIGQRKGEYALPPLELSNVGGSRGARPEVLGKMIASAIFTRIQQAAADHMKAVAAERIKQEIGERLGEILGDDTSPHRTDSIP